MKIAAFIVQRTSKLDPRDVTEAVYGLPPRIEREYRTHSNDRFVTSHRQQADEVVDELTDLFGHVNTYEVVELEIEVQA
jgi:hypothetical protein